MIGCTEAITVVHRAYNPTLDVDTYICTPVTGVSWHGSQAITGDSNGIKATNLYSVRIPKESIPSGLGIRSGDYIVKGIVSSVTKQTDLEAYIYFEAKSVTENFRGTLKHVAIQGG